MKYLWLQSNKPIAEFKLNHKQQLGCTGNQHCNGYLCLPNNQIGYRRGLILEMTTNKSLY